MNYIVYLIYIKKKTTSSPFVEETYYFWVYATAFFT